MKIQSAHVTTKLEKGALYWYMDAIYVRLEDHWIQRLDDWIGNQDLDADAATDEDYQYIKIGTLTPALIKKIKESKETERKDGGK